MKNADLRGTHDLGSIIGLAYRLYARNFAGLLAIAAITVPTHMLAIIAVRRAAPNSTAYALAQLLYVPDALVALLAGGALIYAVHEVTGGTPPDFGRSLDAALSRFGAMLSTLVLAAVLVVASLIFFPYFAVRWTLSQQGVMIEGKRNWAALDASSYAVRGRWWRTFGIVVVIALIALGPTLIAASSAVAPPIVEGIVTSAVSALVLPFVVIAQTLLYYDLKARQHADAGPDRLPAPEQDVPR